VDTIIESDADSHTFFVDAGTSQVGVVENTWVAGSFSGDLNVISAATDTKSVLALDTYNNQSDPYNSELLFFKSHNDTMGTLTATIDGEALGKINFYGVDSGNLKDLGCGISVLQDGAAGTKVPTNLIFSPHSSTANVEALRLAFDENVFNEGSADMDFRVEGDNEASLLSVDAGEDYVAVTTSQTDMWGLLVDCNAATGATGKPALRIDSEQTDTAALYITSAVDGTGTSAIYDDYALAVVGESGGGVAHLYRDNATANVLCYLQNDHVDMSGSVLLVTTDSDASAANPMVNFTTDTATFDQPVLQVTQAGPGNGIRIDNAVNSIPLYIYNAGTTTNSVIVSEQHNSLTTGGLMYLHSNSSDSSARNLVNIVNDSTSATGAVPFRIQQDAPTATNFKKIMEVGGFTMYVSDGTTAEGALTGVEGDICLNGGTGAGQMAYCDANGTNWTDM